MIRRLSCPAAAVGCRRVMSDSTSARRFISVLRGFQFIAHVEGGTELVANASEDLAGADKKGLLVIRSPRTRSCGILPIDAGVEAADQLLGGQPSAGA